MSKMKIGSAIMGMAIGAAGAAAAMSMSKGRATKLKNSAERAMNDVRDMMGRH